MTSIIPTLIYDVKGLELTPDERDRLRHPASAGVILFERNYENPTQLSALTRSILKENKNIFITVDQEGGRVQRFRNGFSKLPSMRSWGDQYHDNPTETMDAVRCVAMQMAEELQKHHVTLSYMPVLDLDYNHNQVIGHRSFHRNPKVVTELGGAFIEGLHLKHMLAVGKHFPGHGFVTLDSHARLPIDSRDINEIENNDLIPFCKLSKELDAIMPAHIIYTSVDNVPACCSKIWLQKILRRKLGFTGAIITDDLNMGAMRQFGSIENCVEQVLEAGCDFLLICNNQRDAAWTLEYLERDKTFDAARKRRVNEFIIKSKS